MNEFGEIYGRRGVVFVKKKSKIVNKKQKRKSAHFK